MYLSPTPLTPSVALGAPRTRDHTKATRSMPPSRRTTAPNPAGAFGSRTQIVWVSLVAAMTGLGGLLLALDGSGGQGLRSGGMSLAPLAAATSSSSVESIFDTRKPLDAARWECIVIHHSAAPAGNQETVDRDHRGLGDRGLGHHFVIGNGRGMSDGAVYVGYRWMEQQGGTRAAPPHGPWLNEHAISICLIGDGNRGTFTEAQMQRLVQLTRSLAREFSISPRDIHLHSDVAEVADPGRFFPEAQFRESLGRW